MRVRASFIPLFVLAIVLASTLGAASAGAAMVAEFPIATGSGDQLYPSIYGNKIVWQDQRGPDAEIYAYDLLAGSESRVTNHPANQMLPDIYQDLVVYQDARNGFMDVFLMDLATSTEQQLTPTGTRQDQAAIWGDKVVWRDQRNGTYDIYSRSLSSGFETRLTANASDQESPDINGDLVVYQDMRNGNWEIYAYDLSVGNESRITNQGSDQTGPMVSSKLIAWTDYRLGTADVWAYDLVTRTAFQVAAGPGDQVLQGVYGGRVVWTDLTVDLTVAYDTATAASSPLLPAGLSDHIGAAVYGDKIVIAGTGTVSGDYDVVMVTVDETAPKTTASGIPTGWVSSPITVTLTGDDTLAGSGVDDTYYSLNGAPTVTYTGPFVIAAEGTTQIDFWSEDMAGNVESTNTTYAKIDTLAPVTTSDIDPSWQEGPVTVTLGAADGDGSGVAWTLYSVDGADLQTYTGPFTVSGEGQHTVSFTSADKIGHTEILHTEFVRIDNSDPITTSDIDSSWQNGPVSVTLSVEEPYSGVADTFYSLDGSVPSLPYSGPFSISSEGTTTVKYFSVDALGHTESVTSELVRIDNSAPVTTSDIDPAWQTGPVTVTLSASDAYSGVSATMYSLNGGAPVAYTAPFSVTAEGTTTVDFYSVDMIGETETVVSEMVRIDNTDPVTTSDIDPDWQVGPVTVTLTAVDPLSGVDTTYYSTDGSFPTSVYSGSFVVSADGITTVKFYSTDTVGNTEGVTTEQVMIDNEAPDTSSDIDSAWQNGPVTVTLSVVDDDSGPIETFYSTDGTDPTVPYTTPFVITDEGTTTVKYYSVDEYGHVEVTESEIVRIDNTAPVSTSDIDPAWQTGPVTVTITPTDPYSGVVATYYYIDGQAPARPYTGPFVVSAQGETLVTFYSIDALGHVEGPVSDTVRIDNTAPSTTSDIDSDWQTGPVTVTLTASYPHSGVDVTYYSIDDTIPSVVYSGPFVVSDEGTTTVHFFSMDKYGHMETVHTQILQIDNTAPSTSSDIDPAWQDGPVTVTISPSDAHSGVAETYYSLDGSAPGLAYRSPIVITDEGTTTVKFYSVDVYGHTEGVTTQYVHVDNTAPETESDIDSAWQTSPVTVTLSATDPYSGVDETYYSIDDSVPSVLYTGPFDITAEGTTTVKFRSVDELGHMESVTTEFVRIDDTAPVTTDDAPADWQTSPVAVTLSPVDLHSGVAVTYYSLDGSIPTVVYKNPITISAQGTTTIRYYSVDKYGHSEAVKTATVRIDDTIPVTVPNIDSAWRNSAATVTLSTNAEWIYYSVDGSDPTTLYTAPFVVSGEGITTVKYRSESKAHVFEAIQAKDVRIDYTPPTTTTDAEDLFWDIAYIPVQATDALSGVAKSYMRLDGGDIQETSDISVTRLGDHTVEFWSMDVAGNVEAAGGHSFTVKPSTTDFAVIAGSNRIATAIKVSQASHPDGADFVVLATGRNWPDALGGAALAGAYDAPILLVNGSLPDSVANEIRRLAPEKALILGGVGAVSEEIEGQVREIVGVGAVERFWGNTRYATADTIAFRVLERLGSKYDGTAFVVTGASFPDAVVGSPMAAANGWPIFLAAADGLPASSKAAMADIGVSKVIVLGGEGVISAGVFADLESTYGAGNVIRLSGANRYATALEAARYGTTEGNLMWDGVAIATGEQFADALTGGVLQGLNGSTMLLTRPNALPASVDSELEAKRDFIGSVNYLGGDAAVGPAVRSRIGQILR